MIFLAGADEPSQAVEAPAAPGTHARAAEWFRARVSVSPAEWAALDEQARQYAFTVSGLASEDLVQQLQDALAHAIEHGESFEGFRARIGEQLANSWGNASSGRLDTIFRNAVQKSYGAQRYAEMTAPDVLAERPFWRFEAIMDGRTTVVCTQRDGVLKRADDAWWNANWPPLHHRCRSGVVSLSEHEVHEQGGLSAHRVVPPVPSGWGAAPGAAPDLMLPTFHQFDEKTLRTTVETSVAGTRVAQPSGADQKVIRDQFRALSDAERVRWRPRQDSDRVELKAPADMAGADGAHQPGGSMWVTKEEMERLGGFLGARGKGHEPTQEQSNAFLTFLHETLHENSVINASMNHGIYLGLEEAMTELAARHIGRVHAGITGTVVGLPNEDGITARHYDRFILTFRDAIRDGLAANGQTLSEAELSHAMIEASLAMKRQANVFPRGSEQDYLEAVVEALVLPPQVDTVRSRMALTSHFQTLAGLRP